MELEYLLRHGGPSASARGGHVFVVEFSAAEYIQEQFIAGLWGACWWYIAKCSAMQQQQAQGYGVGGARLG